MKKLLWIAPVIILAALLIAAVTPNVPLYVHWDGTIAAPTQFLNATFKAGANITLTDNRTNLTIASGSGIGSNSVVIVPGTNIVVTTNITGTNITYTVSTSGSTTNQVYYSSLVQTNFAYTSNNVIDASYAQNIWIMTNQMTGHINFTFTNWVAPSTLTLVLWGANAFTNLNVYMTNDLSTTFQWLSLTNGRPMTTITSNQYIQIDFMAVTTSTNTNVMAAWKETCK